MTLSGEQAQQTARETADSLAGVTSGRPFTKDLDVYKVAGKVFLIVTDDPQELVITVKAEPDRGSALRRDHPTITRGRYLDKDHWVSVGPGKAISEDLIEDLVDDSYQLVRASLPTKDRPDAR